MERSIARCDRIINDLLDYSRLRELRRRSWEIDPWIDEVLDDQKLPKDITLIRHLGVPGRHASFDADLMRRAMTNLLENAVHALAETGAAERLIIVGTRAKSERLELTIGDTGPGIATDILPKVFEPLFSTKGFGAGLGLPMVKQIIEQHGGSIVIASTSGIGTTVTMLLPLPATAAKTTTKEAA
jgi:signal transduction histidine kinase